jgi:hypothetical protein
MKQRFDWLEVSDRLLGRYLELTSRPARELPPAVYLLLGLLALLQAANPGSIERIASQGLGRGLLAGLAGLLVLSALFTVGDALLRHPRGVLAPSACDALLHTTLAAVGLKLAFGADLIPEPAGALVIGGLGLSSAGAGAYLLCMAALRSWRAKGLWSQHQLRGLLRRDYLVRGGVIAGLGALLFAASVSNIPELGFEPSRHDLSTPLLVLTVLALLAYCLHSVWSIHVEALRSSRGEVSTTPA